MIFPLTPCHVGPSFTFFFLFLLPRGFAACCVTRTPLVSSLVVIPQHVNSKACKPPLLTHTSATHPIFVILALLGPAWDTNSAAL